MLKHMINPGYPAAGPQRVGHAEYVGRMNTTASSYHSGRPISQPNSPSGSIHHTPKAVNGGLHIPRAPDTPDHHSRVIAPSATPSATCENVAVGVKEMLTSLGLLCLISLLLALLSLIFLLKISPVTATDVQDLLRPDQSTVISPEEYVIVYEVTLALCALSLSLNLCCLLVCAVQFLFAVKLVRDSPDGERTNKYLKKSSVTRVCAVSGFFISIPVFLTGLILYTFIQFHSTPAIVTSALIGLGIIFCGCAMVHNVFVWQKEKTNAVRALAQQQRMQLQQSNHSMHSVASIPLPHSEQVSIIKSHHHHNHHHHHQNHHNHSITREASGSISPGAVPHATMDLSSVATTPHELSTLV